MGYISSLFSDPRATLMVLLLALPGRLLALSAHEAAHGWVAEKCGDPTARMMGRVTLNPLAHIDPIGALCMVVLGFGWARPVPVNPRNFRKYRRDDLLVSLAGITANLILFIIGCVLMYAFFAAALMRLPYEANAYMASGDLFRSTMEGVPALISGRYWYRMSDLLCYAVNAADFLIAPVFGRTVGYIYEMVSYFVMTNLVLAIFNLIPVPPLDGFHVASDLLVRRGVRITPQAARTGTLLLYLAVFTGGLSKLIGFVYTHLFSVVGALVSALFSLLHLI